MVENLHMLGRTARAAAPTRVAFAAALAALAALSTIPAAAHADDNDLMLITPSQNIRCAMVGQSETPYVACQLKNIDYVVPAGTAHDPGGAPCPSGTGSGNDVMLERGRPGFVACSYAAIGGGVTDWTTLAYGDSVSIAGMTCASESTALTCTDTGTGHFFRVSRESYEVG
jgi:hypothetical protein